MYVVSHHCSEYGSLELNSLLKSAKNKIPVIVDAASEEYMEDFLKLVDVAIFSAHKFMGSLTAGIIAGKKNLSKIFIFKI